ncbi:protein IQ-DOMAIN 1-like isoform X1 [Phoenix dactylifera]|uniref:Protein IQ-DOMAIN 1-like isoform X1 n=1 Tax=Phoenix dactylifera TaxID=42345 RepID=A0A8B8ZP36_PHODC|nr:protein IQ-DOMAIN 1-like isoform X1 [Phoenix dactylifera]
MKDLCPVHSGLLSSFWVSPLVNSVNAGLFIMGKKGGSSWLTAVKRAFRSPSKDSERRPSRPHEDPDPDEDKKREKRRWIFRKASTHEQQQTQQEAEVRSLTASSVVSTTAEQRHAMEVAAATAATSEAAVATAQAAAEVVRLTRPSVNFVREHYAAIVIQAGFRGYLARRALKALRGLVKLQALVRGQNVRRQANTTLRCMQALVRVQERVRDQRARLAREGASWRSNKSTTFSCDTSFWDSRYLHDIADRRSMQSRDGSGRADDWVDHPRTIEEIQSMLEGRKEAALRRERALSYAFSQQPWRSDRKTSSGLSFGEEQEEDSAVSEGEQRPRRWLDRWMASRTSCDNRNASRGRATMERDPIKTLEIDTARSYSTPTTARRHQQPASPHHLHSPATPSPSNASRALQVRSASPRCGSEERSSASVHTPTSSGYYRYSGEGGQRRHHHHPAVPNYMAATESAKARLRSQSATRQRPMTPEREQRSGLARKRLSFPLPEPYGGGGDRGGYPQSLRSPSFKSANGRIGEQSSCCTESIAGEVSPTSTTYLRRWLR